MALSRTDRRPVIGVTGPYKGGTTAWLFTWWAVLVAGGHAVRIQPGRRLPVTELDGLIIGGGADIDPDRYGETPTESKEVPVPRGFWSWCRYLFSLVFYPLIWLLRWGGSSKNSAIDPARDRLEFDLAEAALKRDMPVLGICRGAQLINIVQGGTLHQELSGFYGEVPRIHTIRPKKRVRLEPESKLRKLMIGNGAYVNGLHKQAIDRLGDGLIVAAKEANGVVQAIESVEHRFVIGVQWHPEYMPQVACQRRLFEELVAQVSR